MLSKKNTPEQWHRVKPIENSIQVVGTSTNGICSICGPTQLWFLGGTYQCSTRDTRYFKVLNKDIKITKNKIRWIEKAYGLKFEDYIDMFIVQNGQCALCKKNITLSVGESDAAHVDHDRKCCSFNARFNTPVCGKCNRGLLCSSCNMGIGYLKDNAITLKNAIDYLQKYSS